jgi:hypothetical protein
MSTKIAVRQNEVVVVQGSMMEEVSSMFTVGMNPCIGLVLWSPTMCALGHFHDWDTMGRCGVVIKHFCKVSSTGQRKAVIVRAKGEIHGGSAWHSEAMNVDLEKLLKPLTAEVVRPAPPGESAKVKITLEDGNLNYGFSGQSSTSFVRTPVEDWTSHPHLAKFLVIGVYGGSNKIRYVHGDKDVELQDLLSETA